MHADDDISRNNAASADLVYHLEALTQDRLTAGVRKAFLQTKYIVSYGKEKPAVQVMTSGILRTIVQPGFTKKAMSETSTNPILSLHNCYSLFSFYSGRPSISSVGSGCSRTTRRSSNERISNAHEAGTATQQQLFSLIIQSDVLVRGQEKIIGGSDDGRQSKICCGSVTQQLMLATDQRGDQSGCGDANDADS